MRDINLLTTINEMPPVEQLGLLRRSDLPNEMMRESRRVLYCIYLRLMCFSAPAYVTDLTNAK